MDINEINNSYQTKLPSATKVDRGQGFKKVLGEKISEIAPKAEMAGVEHRAQVLGQSQKVINLLDDYARGLTDPTKTLKDMEPLVEHIQKEVGLMEATAVQKAEEDKDFDRFIKDLAITAKVAAFKFYRGDYL